MSVGAAVKKRFVDWDGTPWPEPGDFFMNPATGNCWAIHEIRPGKEGSDTIFTAVCERLDKDALFIGQEGVFYCEPAPRKRPRTL